MAKTKGNWKSVGKRPRSVQAQKPPKPRQLGEIALNEQAAREAAKKGDSN